MSTTPSMTTPSIEDGTAHNPILLTDENSTTSINVQLTDPPVIFERSRPFGNEIQNLPDYVVRTLFEWIRVSTIFQLHLDLILTEKLYVDFINFSGDVFKHSS